MRCPKCGEPMPIGTKFCAECGARMPQQPEPTMRPGIPTEPNPTVPISPQPMKMKWFKWLIWFLLWVGAVSNFASAIQFLGGLHYGEDATLVYAFFPSLHVLDMVVGVLELLLAAFQVYTRFMLAKFRRIGPTCLLVTYCAATVLSLFYVIAASILLGENCMDSSTWAALAGNITMIFCNRTYFKKREHLFIH